jgi:hypothetical protein
MVASSLSPAAAAVAAADHITCTGQAVSFDRDPVRGWIATGWEQGLPVARRPVSDAELLAVLIRWPDFLAA